MASITITAPGATGDMSRVSENGPAEPLVCHIGGVFDYSNDYQLDGIRVLVQKRDDGAGNFTGDPYASTQDEVDAVEDRNSGAFDVAPANIDLQNNTWFIDKSVTGNIDRDPQYTWNLISVVAQVTALGAEAPALTAAERLASKSFKAMPVDDCAKAAAAPCHRDSDLADHAAAPARPTPPAPPMLKPVEVTDGWIRYSFFSLSGGNIPMPPANGFVLGKPGCCGTALTAREIAIAGGTVDWKPRPNRDLVICRPYGIIDTSPVDGSPSRKMQFGGLPKFCLVVHQLHTSPNDPIMTPVDSECRTRPLRIRLSPSQPIYVQVNNVKNDRTESDGTLDFWVKILV